MPPLCDCCCEHVEKLTNQVSVMRKEIKNLRQLLDSALRGNRKHVASIQSLLSKIVQGEIEGQSYMSSQPQMTERDANVSLEQGIIQTTPIGYISSCFLEKNGTPRQPTICGHSRALLRIQHSLFNNPEHALVGLEQYSHVWVIFLFNKNGHMSCKAKVKPPRLNGQRVGVYSTRSPHRPNALGLTLAKLDSIVGDTVHLSDIDMIAGTPVLDIKPYIPEYDFPKSRMRMNLEDYALEADQQIEITRSLGEVENALHSFTRSSSGIDAQEIQRESLHKHDLRALLHKDKADIPSKDDATCLTDHNIPPLAPNINTVLEEVKAFIGKDLSHLTPERKFSISDNKYTNIANSVDGARPCYGEESFSTIAGWIRDPPVARLEVRFTPNAEGELGEFLPSQHSGPSGGRPRFKFLRSPEEAVAAIKGVLSADPRSVYRRTRCGDRLFFFILDTADVTCWFGKGFAEVLQVRPVVHNS